MEDFTEPGVMETSTMYSQVVFSDIPHSYPPNVPVACVYTLTAAMRPNARDWVGIFKVGWSTTKDYHTFVWVEPCFDVVEEAPVRKQVLFQEYYLPKDESEFYQFCYVDSSGQVRGASTPFCYRAAGEQSMDCSMENDLLVIHTQEQVEQSEREKEELVTELGQMKQQNQTLRTDLEERQQEVHQLKESNMELAQAVSTLGERQLLQAREQEVLTQKVEEQELTLQAREQEVLTQKVKEQELTQKVKEQELTLKAREHEELTQSAKSTDGQEESLNPPTEARYKRAVMKIKQLKLEREELRGEVGSLSGEVAQLRPRVTDSLIQNDRVQLLQMDLQTSEKEKERLSAELQRLRGAVNGDLDGLRTENQALRQSLSDLEGLGVGGAQGAADGADWQMQYQALLGQLQDARSQLHQEMSASNSALRRTELAERELEEVKEQLETRSAASNQMTQKSSKLEMQMTEMYKQMEEKENLAQITQEEKEELARENQGLTRDIERLRQEFAGNQAAPPAQRAAPPAPPAQPTAPPSVSLHYSSPYGSGEAPFVDLTSTGATQQQQGSWSESLHYGNPYENTGTSAVVEEVVSLECQYCQEKFPGITEEELETHEQSHRVCPFCTLICDPMEQAVFEDHVYSHEV